MKLKAKTTTCFAGERRTRRGFTLVELIVVLAILALLAAIGVASAIGYINRSRFDENSQGAITVYQAAQTALTQMESNGSIDQWVLDEFGTSHFANYSSLDQPNKSDHATVALTFNPNSASATEDSALYGLLYSYFYDQSIFSGTMTVVFDISATRNATGTIDHSAYVLAAFFSKQNNTPSGWDADYINGNTDEAPWNTLPDRDITFRRTHSYVGYFDGSEASVAIVRGSGSVMFPEAVAGEQVIDPVGPIAGSTVNPNDTATGFLFNLRNGETLDVMWSVFGDGMPSNTPVTITLIDRDSGGRTTLTIPASVYATTLNSSPITTFEYVKKGDIFFNIKKTSREGLVQIHVTYSNGSTADLYFPLTITDVEGDKRLGAPTSGAYTMYTLSLDCLMTRSDYETNGLTSTSNYSFARFTGYGQTPRNICATIKSTDGTLIPETYASRAIDDPIYFTGVQLRNSHTTMCYNTRNGVARYDISDFETPVVICYVNTFFGDLSYSAPGSLSSMGGSFSGTSGDAVITSFRHLSNIRMLGSDSEGAAAINYRIARTLNWYTQTTGTLPVSEVKVYTSNRNASYRYHSPVESPQGSDDIKIVSFPALRELYTNEHLSSLSSSSAIYSINNIQMRVASFRNTGNVNTSDHAYGLICENRGTIYNIYTNNLNLVLENVSDGSASDYSRISSDSEITIDTNVGGVTRAVNSRPIGGLVGINRGSVGMAGLDDSENTIVMSNCIVMGGRYWNVNNYDYGIGGVIGANGGSIGTDGKLATANNINSSNSTYGVISVNGTVVVLGRDYVGGVIGISYSDIGARINVGGTPIGDSAFTLPKESRITSGERMSFVVAGRNAVGGAIGYINGVQFTSTVSDKFNSIGNNYDDGIEFNVDDIDANYQINVNLPSNALILNYAGGSDDYGCGGAVGRMTSCSGDYFSVKVNNSGYILVLDTGKRIYCGGAIGRDESCSTPIVFVSVTNGAGSRIGSMSDSVGPTCSGGAYGHIQCGAGRVFAIDVDNSGTIIARGGNQGQGAGGAIGGTGSGVDATFYVNVVNSTTSCIRSVSTATVDKYDGVGGAIGSMYKDTGNKIHAGSVIYVENRHIISGVYHVGGAIGNSSPNDGKIYAVNIGATISGTDFVGGAIGFEYEAHTGVIQATLNTTTIEGVDFIGGAAGALQSVSDNAYVTTIVRGGTTNIAGSGSLVGGVCGDIKVYYMSHTGAIALRGDDSDSATLNVGSTTTNDGVGGVAGMLRVCNNKINWHLYMPTQEPGDRLIVNVDGNNYVGGAIGYLCDSETNRSNSADALIATGLKAHDMLLDISVVIRPESHVVGRGSNVGGAVGLISTGANAKYQGYLSVRTVAGTVSNDSGISGADNVGGAVGHFNNIYPALYNSSYISVDFNVAPYSVMGDNNIGGAIGVTEGTTNQTVSVPEITVHLGCSNVTGTGSNVGGAIGKTSLVNSSNMLYQKDITVTYTGPSSDSCNISGVDCVGGVIGYNSSRISGTVSFTVSGYAHVIGNYYVGGAIGYSLNAISNVTATINTDNAVQGVKFVGGAIGRLGSDTDTASAGTVCAVINTAYPIYQSSSVGTSEDACIGGVIGQVTRGTVTSVELSGNGAAATVDSSMIPNFQSRSYSNLIIISAKGRSIGGVIGLIGDGTHTDAKVLSISAGNATATTANTLGVAVISTNASQRVGGCVGACFGTIGNGWSNTTISIPSIKIVYSNNECIGGFCGTLNRASGGQANINARIYVDFDRAVVSGRARVGGIFGDVNGATISGNLRVSLNNGTRIGDFNGNVTTATDSVDTTNCICVEAGGAIGRIINTTINTNAANPNSTRSNVEDHTPIRTTDSYGRISVEILDEGSKIFAGSTNVAGLDEGLTLEIAGVGGAVGRFGTPNSTDANAPKYGQSNTYEACMYVYSPSTYISVYSAGASAGGGIGHVFSGELRGCFSTATVRCDGVGETIGTGGFIGTMDAGRIYNSYCGGHTVNGQYIPGFENVSGVYNVGGFIGYAGSRVNCINQCYSTASVRGDSYVGGFMGRIVSTTNNLFQEDYCTGLVSGFDSSIINPENFGSFAGWAPGTNVFRNSGTKSANKIVRAQNRNILRVGNLTDINNNHVYPARFELRDGGPYYVYGNDCIRTNGASNYTAYPFDTSLFPPIIPQSEWPNGTIYFPLRTFISYQVSSTWYGTHYGDWPVIPNDNILDYQNVTINGLTYPYENLRYPYSNVGQFIPLDDIVVVFDENILHVNTDYTVSFFTRGATEGTVVITGIGDYYGPVPINFIIDPANLATLSDSRVLTVTGIEDSYDYTGSPIEPVPTLTWNEQNLIAGTDYTVTYTNNVECGGTATVTITGTGNYTGTITKTFEISTAEIHDSDVTGIDSSYTYTGSAITPVPSINIGGRDLIAGTDYLISYTDNNVNAGEIVTVTISQKDGSNYTIATPITRTFTITPAPLNTVVFAYIGGEHTPYTGQEIKPITGTYNGITLVEGTDYTITYPADITDVGNIEVTIDGLGNFEGTVIGTYTIDPLTITDECVTGIDATYTHTEAAIEPTPTVTVNEVVIAEGTDYTVTYSNNTDIGTATVTVTGQGNYTGEVTRTFQIVPESCTVTFYANAQEYATATVPYGRSVTKPADPPPSSYGMVFDYWAVGTEEGERYDFSANVTEDLVLVAVWTEQYTVTFNSMGGSSVDPAYVYPGAQVNEPAQPSLDGHSFLGWFREGATESYDFTSAVNESFTLYAHWEETTTDPQQDNTTSGDGGTPDNDTSGEGTETGGENPSGNTDGDTSGDTGGGTEGG